MTHHDHDEVRLSLGSYLAGALDASSRREVDVHLERCVACQRELAELAVLPGLLARVGNLVDEETVEVPATLRVAVLSRVRHERNAQRARLRAWRVAASTLALVAASLLVVVVARSPSSPVGVGYALRPASATVRLRGVATLIPKAWGTEVSFSLQGVPAGLDCEAVVVTAQGTSQVIGNWGSTPTHSVEVAVATHLTASRLRSVRVATLDGRTLLIARVA
jgi:anti-sigma factor RsiW